MCFHSLASLDSQKRLSPDFHSHPSYCSECSCKLNPPVTYQALVRCAEDVIHTLAEILPYDGQSRERWVLDLERLKEKLHSAVHFILQTLRAVSSYHHNYNKVSSHFIPSHTLHAQKIMRRKTEPSRLPEPVLCSSYRPAVGTVWSCVRTSSRSCCRALMESGLPHRGRGGTGGRSPHGDAGCPLS